MFKLERICEYVSYIITEKNHFGFPETPKPNKEKLNYHVFISHLEYI